MGRTWRSVTVELLGGRGEEWWPWPGRVLAVGPEHSFQQLAEAVEDSFGRWDRAHLSVFTLADGRVVTDRETGRELATSVGGPVLAPLDIETTSVLATVGADAEFQYTFDLGDDWVHRCVVGAEWIEPPGASSERPVPYAGWGTLPDQHGRRWADDDGERRPPVRPTHPHPMLLGLWPSHEAVPEIDLAEVRSAIAQADADRFLAAMSGCDIEDVLQQVGVGMTMALHLRRDQAQSSAASLVNRLRMRAGPGDDVLADDLVARLRDEPVGGREVPVDLDLLAAGLDADPTMSAGVYLDLQTGEVLDESLTDPMMVGEDAAVDVEDEPDRWLWLEGGDSREAWEDMAAFAARQRDSSLGERLEQVIRGRGAFRRFRDLVDEEGLTRPWNAFETDRQWGRARDLLARHGLRVR